MSETLRDETLRLVALGGTSLLATPDDYAFDCAAHIGSQLFNVPLCVLMLAGVEQDWTKSRVALETRETSTIDVLCDEIVHTAEPIIIEDALTHSRIVRGECASHPSRIRFFAGYPIRAATGKVLGALCLVNFEPMQFPPAQLWLFRELAFLTELSLFARRIGTAQKALVAKLDCARRESLVDPLLRIWNRGGITTILEQLHKDSIKKAVPFSILMIDIDRFKRINDRQGHIAGDTVLKAVTRVLQASMRPDDEVGRYGGEEFIAVLPNTDAANAIALAHRVNKAVAELRIETTAGLVACTVSIGVAEWVPRRLESVQALVHRADVAMLSAKQCGRDRVLVSQTGALRGAASKID